MTKKIGDKPRFPVLERYGAKITTNPPYVIAGRLFIGGKSFTGLIGFASNEIFAHIIRRELNKEGNSVVVERTEYHPDGPTLNVEEWLAARKRKANV